MIGVAASTFSANGIATGIVNFLGPGIVVGFILGIWARGRGHFK